MVGNKTDKTFFPDKLLLTDRQVSKLPKAFAYNFSANVNFSKVHISKTKHLGRFLGRFL